LRRDRRPDISAPAFLSQADLTEAQKDVAELQKAAVAPNFLNREVLTYAELHPEDERVPQALHLGVRATRYGCTDSETTRWSEKSFRLLHQRYPKSEWAEKTKYHY